MSKLFGFGQKKLVRDTAELERLSAELSQRKLMFMKFKQHKLALVSAVLLICFYLCAIFGDFIAPYEVDKRLNGLQNFPPSQVHLFHEGKLQAPFVYGFARELDQETFQYKIVEDKEKVVPLKFFAKGSAYKLFGFIPADRHLFAPADPSVPVALFGTDRLGRDLFSRIVVGSQISLSIGLLGVILSFTIGVIIGGISGYYGGVIDEIIQRVIDFIVSIPTIPLWMTLSAAIPRNWPVTRTYFAITLILSLVGWCSLARTIRGKLLSLREEDFAAAAKVSGASSFRVVTKHLLPAFSSYLIVSLSLSVPRMILSETSLSFLGLGMQAPAVSWGVLLQDAQNLLAISQYSWQLLPAIFVIVVVLMFNFMGDGLRDAADPFTSKMD